MKCTYKVISIERSVGRLITVGFRERLPSTPPRKIATKYILFYIWSLISIKTTVHFNYVFNTEWCIFFFYRKWHQYMIINTSYFFHSSRPKHYWSFGVLVKKLKPLIQFNKYSWNTYFLKPIVSHVNMTKMKNEKCALKN